MQYYMEQWIARARRAWEERRENNRENKWKKEWREEEKEDIEWEEWKERTKNLSEEEIKKEPGGAKKLKKKLEEDKRLAEWKKEWREEEKEQREWKEWEERTKNLSEEEIKKEPGAAERLEKKKILAQWKKERTELEKEQREWEERTKNLSEEEIKKEPGGAKKLKKKKRLEQWEKAWAEWKKERDKGREERKKKLEEEKIKEKLWKRHLNISNKHEEKLKEERIREEQEEQAHLDRIMGTTDKIFLYQYLIKKETYQDLQGLTVSDKKVSFRVYKDINEAGLGQVSSILTYYEDEVYGQLGSKYSQYGPRLIEEGMTILSPLPPVSRLQKADRFVITKSPIEALSYRQLEQTGTEEWRVAVGAKQEFVSYTQQSTAYLSTFYYTNDENGVLDEDLETVFKLAYKQGKTVVLAINKFEAFGWETQDLISKLEQIGTKYYIEEPTLCRNWNDNLKAFFLLSQMDREAAMRERQAELDLYQAREQAEARLDRVGATAQTYFSKCLINKETYQDLKGLTVDDEKVSFSLYKDINEAGIVGELCNTIIYSTYRDRDYRYWGSYVSGTEYFTKRLENETKAEAGLTILSPVRCLTEADRFVITECPIDALSYRQLEQIGAKECITGVGGNQESVSCDQQSTVYLSTYGGLTNQIRKDLEAVFNLAYEQSKTVVLAMNKDKTLSETGQSLRHMIKEAGTSYHIDEPMLGETWNDTLKQATFLPQMAKEVDMRERQAEVIKTRELLTYQDSVWPHLGIKQETLEGFKEQVKVTQRSLEMSIHPIGVNSELKAGQAGVINNQEAGVERPAQTVVGRWSLWVDQKGDIQLPRSEKLPSLATLRQEPELVSKVVLVCSPLDALLHYQSSIANPQSNSRWWLDHTSYVYIGQKDSGSVHPFEAVTEMFKDKNLSLVIRGDHDIRFDSLEARLKQQRIFYQKELIDTNAQVYEKLNLMESSLSHKKLNLLERSFKLLTGVTGARGVGGEEGEEDEEEQQRRNINKKKGYRPSL